MFANNPYAVLPLGMPIFDTLFSMLQRFLERRSLFAPDRSHFHHRLTNLSLKQRHVVLMIYTITLFVAGFGMLMMATRNTSSLIVLFCILLLLLIFRVVGSVRLRETVVKLKEKYAIPKRMKEEVRSFERVKFYVCQAEAFDQWWQAVCAAAEELDFIRIKLSLRYVGNTPHVLIWQRNGNEPDQPEAVKINIPIRDIKTNSPLNIEVDVNVNDSLESAGLRASPFSRLLDEYGAVDIPTKRSRSMIPAG